MQKDNTKFPFTSTFTYKPSSHPPSFSLASPLKHRMRHTHKGRSYNEREKVARSTLS